MRARAIPLLYHDVICSGNYDGSGFSGPNAAEYKLSTKEFRAHLHAIKAALQSPVVTADGLGEVVAGEPPVLLTFDDGGVSAVEIIAPMLEEFGWRGCFFISTDYIDRPAFLGCEQIRDLHARGHVVGSHSCSHPRRISDCSREQLLDEWQCSLQVLEEIIGEPVTVASIPGGFYARKVVEAADDSGIRILFTSEPVQTINRIGDCTVVGRFSVKRGDPSSLPARFVAGDRLCRFRQYAWWNIKKAAKALTGPVYPWIRSAWLARK